MGKLQEYWLGAKVLWMRVEDFFMDLVAYSLTDKPMATSLVLLGVLLGVPLGLLF